MHKRAGIRIAVSFATATAVGCGLSGVDELFDGKGAAARGSDADGGGGATGSAVGSSDGGAMPHEIPGGGGGGGVPSESGAGGSTESASGGASTASSSNTSGSSSSSSGGGARMLPCVSFECPQGDDSACCFSPLLGKNRCVSGPVEHDGCYTEPAVGGYETRIACGSPSDCGPGETCCGYRVSLGPNAAYYTRTACTSSCGAPDTPLCDIEAPVGESCPGSTCAATKLLPPGYFVCAP